MTVLALQSTQTVAFEFMMQVLMSMDCTYALHPMDLVLILEKLSGLQFMVSAGLLATFPFLPSIPTKCLDLESKEMNKWTKRRMGKTEGKEKGMIDLNCSWNESFGRGEEGRIYSCV